MESPLFKSDTTNRSLVLAGGGVRLAYHAGVLKALEEGNIAFNHVDGTSGGIFNTGMLASGQNPAEICNRWRMLNVMDFMSPTPLKNYLKLTRMNAMGDADGIRKKVFPTLGIEVAKINKNKRFEATFNVCNFSTKEIENISGHKVTENHLIAGMSLPIFMPSIKIEADWYTDAVWVKDANLMEAVKHGADEIFLVYCIGNSREYLEGSFLQYVHMIEMSAAGGLLAEFDWITQINIQIIRGSSPYGQQKPVKLQVIKPKYPLPLDPDLFLSHINVSSLINMGYADAKTYLHHVPKNGVPYDFKAVLMNESGVSFQFMGLFQGNLPINEVIQQTSFRVLFDFRLLANDEMDCNFYASIIFANNEISTFDNQVEITNVNNKRIISLTGKFLYQLKTFSFCSKIALNNRFEFSLCLECKQMIFQLNMDEFTIFTQNIKNRIKMIYKSKLYENVGLLAKQKSKNKILKYIYGK
jgi:predicted patatin/cPLA2 family phospholipase